MEGMKLKLLIVCIVVGGLVGLMASPAAAATVIWQSANTDITLTLPFNDLEFENPLTGTEMVKEYAVLEWRDADFAWGTPRWYDDWTVSDPANIDGNADQIWMRWKGHSIRTTTTVASTTVSIHLVGDNNDGLAEVLVDGILVARLDMYTPSPTSQTALIIVKNLAKTPHSITVNDLGQSPSGPIGANEDDVATMGAAALEKRIKWSQPPEPAQPENIFYGWNEPSDYNGHHIVADDWVCQTDDPVTDIHWWGSYKGWKIGYDPSVIPSSFHITIWTDVPDPDPDDPSTFSHPGKVIWETDCDNFTSNFVGWDYDPRTESYEACFKFVQILDEKDYFFQEPQEPGAPPNIYWISIAAEYPSTGVIDNPWGWKTRPRDSTSLAPDDAVRIFDPTAPHVGNQFISGKPIEYPAGKSWDMAFELTTQPLIEVIKYEQPPDLYETGIDVDATGPQPGLWPAQLLADDFPCWNTGQITDIHIWGSWLYDDLPEGDPTNVIFTLSFHNNNPRGPYGWSEPNELLWTCEFGPGQFTVEQVQTFMPEAYYCSCVNVFLPNNHQGVWKYSFYLSDAGCEQFTQKEGNIYWLDVQAEPITFNPNVRFGWKTSIEHFEDDAVWAVGSEAGHTTWRELRDPRTNESLDLAFAVTTVTPGEIDIKWSQPPEPYTPPAYEGWNELSVYNWEQIAADDWFCDSNDPVADIHWWGSFIGWSERELPPEMPEAFHIAIWTDVPRGPDSDFSHPGRVIWETDCREFTVEFAGWDFDPRIDTGTISIRPPDACFKFEQDIPEDQWFRQGRGKNIYWVSIAAKYPSGAIVQNPWGWKVRPREPDSRAPDDAVRIFDPCAPTLHVPYVNGSPITWPTAQDSWDTCFVLTTKPEPPKPPTKHLKWSQPPIEINPMMSRIPIYCGWDEQSWVGMPVVGHPEVADDFRCLGSMPITSIHWWGSYEGWDSSEPPPMRPIAWLFKFWSNVPAHPTTDPSYSHPGKVLWQSVVDANLIHSEWVGYDSFPEKPSEACFQYYVDLKPEEIFRQADFKDKTIDDIFWLGIVALYPQDIMNVTNPWGWKTRPWSWMDDAVSQQCREVQPGVIYCGFWPIEDIFGKSHDVAFELDTDPNYIKWEQPFTGIRNWPHYEDEESMARVVTTTEHVIKWIQKPDLTDRGLDVDATMDRFGMWPPQILADDFQCEATGPITDFHIWGSWYHENLPYGDPNNVVFTLSIHDNIPASPPYPSMPGHLLWMRTFQPGQFNSSIYRSGLREGWYVPCLTPPYYEPYADNTCWQYDFYIDPADAFIQQKGNIYWLDLQAQPQATTPYARFGWKTSLEHWNDDAVWVIGQELYNGPWNDLHYPQGHPLYPQSIDLAFELTTEREKTEFVIDRLVADDWKCERRTPVTAAVWWGSYIGYAYKPCHGQYMALPVKPDYFLLNIWTDVPANVDSTVPFSHPNEIIWEYKAYDYDEVLVGYDKHPLGEPNEPVFRYSVRLPEDNWFLQRDINDIYWFSVVAVYKDPLSTIYPWGWTNHPHAFNDDAVAGHFDPPGGWFWTELRDQTGKSEDMSFVLFTDPDECVGCADYNFDSIVNFIDYADFSDDWRWSGPAGGYNNSDLNCNGIVDFNDLNIFTQQWLSSCP